MDGSHAPILGTVANSRQAFGNAACSNSPLSAKQRYGPVSIIDDINGVGRLIQRSRDGKPTGSIVLDLHMAIVYVSRPAWIRIHLGKVGIAGNGDVKRVFPGIEDE